ncbi:LacI family DNA-binding transcriptional regulator, partial [Anaerotignum faecicola]|nr:LacI family DNA-binding transcriptional regulator [Anaerotignum faecicola]
MQIAEHCGVSLKTVSRVLNHPEQVSPKTREAVRRSMEQCGFQVNL